MKVKDQVKELWKLCFDDTEEFIEMYFRHRYTPNNNIAIQSGDKVISALQMIPYPMTFCGKEIGTSYISGACTHPDFQGKGVMKELLSQSFARMAKENIPVSTLIPAQPWLFGYYGKMGYAPVFNYANRIISSTGISSLPSEASSALKIKSGTEYNENVYRYLNHRMKERNCCIQHTAEDYRVILADLILSGGTVVSACKGDNITGVAVIVPGNETITVNEIFAEDRETESYLLHEGCRLYNASKISIITPPVENEKAHPLGMARILNARQVLKLYASAYPNVEMNIELTDHQISANNSHFYVNGGKCMSTNKKLPGNHLQLTIEELTKLIFDTQHPYMSLMLN